MYWPTASTTSWDQSWIHLVSTCRLVDQSELPFSGWLGCWCPGVRIANPNLQITPHHPRVFGAEGCSGPKKKKVPERTLHGACRNLSGGRKKMCPRAPRRQRQSKGNHVSQAEFNEFQDVTLTLMATNRRKQPTSYVPREALIPPHLKSIFVQLLRNADAINATKAAVRAEHS